MEAQVRAHGYVSVVANRHLRWLFGGFVLAFVVPFVFADLLSLQRTASTTRLNPETGTQ